jgi:uncharacterized protein (TIGR02453 family)
MTLPRNHLKPAFDFLRALQANNSKTWFDSQRSAYQLARERFEQYVDAFIDEFRSIEDFADAQATDCVFRINRDVRFSPDKSPYKISFAASVARGGKHSVRAPYYIHIQPSNESLLAGGVYMPTPEQLAKIRRAIDRDAAPLRKIIRRTAFVQQFGALEGERVKTAPRGYELDHPAIDLLQLKQFAVVHRLSDRNVLGPDLLPKTVEVFKALKPLLDWLNSVLAA